MPYGYEYGNPFGDPNKFTRSTQESEIDRFNQWMRSQPYWQQLAAQTGGGDWGDSQAAALQQQLQSQGITVPKDFHIDEGGNFNQKSRVKRNLAIAGLIAGGALTAGGLAGIGPMAGVFGGGGAAGAAGGAGAMSMPTLGGGATLAGNLGAASALPAIGGAASVPALAGGTTLAANLGGSSALPSIGGLSGGMSLPALGSGGDSLIEGLGGAGQLGPGGEAGFVGPLTGGPANTAGSWMDRLKKGFGNMDKEDWMDMGTNLGSMANAEATNRYAKGALTQGYDRLNLEASQENRNRENDALRNLVRTSYLQSGGAKPLPTRVNSGTLTDLGFGPRPASDAQKQGASTLEQTLLSRLTPAGQIAPTKPDYLNRGKIEQITNAGSIISNGVGIARDIFGK